MNEDHTIAAPGRLARRRNLMVGAAVAGVAVVAARALPGAAPVGAVAPALAKALPDIDGGYRLSPHVRRSYDTTRA